MRAMSNEVRWRVISSYIGAGSFVVDDQQAVVGTDSGLECVPRSKGGADRWRVEFGSRCLGVTRAGDDYLATCRGGLLLVAPDGEEKREKLFAEQLVHEAVPFDSGWLVAAGTTLGYYKDWDDLAWRFSFRDALGKSVESVRLLNLFRCGEHVVTGAVDYDSGIGRAIVLGPDGSAVWMSEPGPLSEVFPVDSESFVWCLTGYGKFESHCSQLNGQPLWLQNFAGVGTASSDGTIAMIVGSNESPQWDNWAVRRIDGGGKIVQELEAKGRAPVRPTVHDGAVYFLGYVLHLDPSSSRVDYTNFFAMPQELHFQHLVGLRKQIPEYEIYVQKVTPESTEVEVLQHVQGSFSLARPLAVDGCVVFCDGPDILAVDL